MKKIINGKKYDTDTAVEVGCIGNIPGNFDSYSDTLFKKRTGEYFIYGHGGPYSKYAESLGNGSWGSGEKIIPLTYEAAKKFAENNFDADIYEKFFGEVKEEEGYTTLSAKTSDYNKLKRYAEKNQISITETISKLLENL